MAAEGSPIATGGCAKLELADRFRRRPSSRLAARTRCSSWKQTTYQATAALAAPSETSGQWTRLPPRPIAWPARSRARWRDGHRLCPAQQFVRFVGLDIPNHGALTVDHDQIAVILPCQRVHDLHLGIKGARTILRVATSQTSASESLPPVARSFPSGENTAEYTSSQPVSSVASSSCVVA